MDKPLLHLFMAIMLYTGQSECSDIPNMQCSTVYKSLGYIGQSHFFYIDKAVDWHEANRTCHSYPNTHLAMFPDEYTLHVISEKVMRVTSKVGDDTAFWFGAHEMTFEKWRWLDDQTYDGRMIDYGGDTKKTCGLVGGRKADNLGYGTCISGKRFLCVNPDADSSNLAADDYYISTTAEAVTWFRAREICLCQGMDLAMAKDGSVDYIYTLLNRSTNQFWIGLQKARFVWESTGEAIDYLPFRPDQPDYWKSVEDCLHVFEGGYNDIDCTGKYSFVCERKYTSNPPDSNSASGPPKSARHYESGATKKTPEEKLQKENNAGIIAAVVISVLVVMVVIAVAVAVLIHRSNKSNTGNRWMRFRDNRGDQGL